MKRSRKTVHFETLAVHAGQRPEPHTGAIMTPIFQTSTYVQEKVGQHKGYDYARVGNPTRTAYEDCVAALEAGEEGKAYGAAFASGCAASATLMHLLKPGDHVISSDDVYGGTFRLFEQVFRAEDKGVEFSFVDLSKEENLVSSFRPNTKMLWIETPTNPMLKIIDIKKVVALAKEKNVISVVDNTFMSPYRQRPLQLGADIVLHSATKYLNGHSDMIGGVTVTQDTKLHERIKFLQKSIGAVPGPMDTWLAMRGIKTLALRMERHEENAAFVLKMLQSHPNVEKIYYPGLPEHPGHKVAAQQMRGFGAIVSFTVKGDKEKACKVAESTNIFSLAETLGGVESLIEHPAIMTHAAVPLEERQKLGITDSLLRISIGVENKEDLALDLEEALH